MTREELKTLLSAREIMELVNAEILNRRPWIFETDAIYQVWLASVASELAVSTDSIRIVGSAATGFSLSPFKPGRPFRKSASASERASDIDIALVDHELFVNAWNTVVLHDRAHSLGGTDESRNKIRIDVYQGLIGQQSVPLNTAAARRLLTAMSVAGRSPPLRGHRVQCRVYRRIEDLRAYHVVSLRRLKAELATA